MRPWHRSSCFGGSCRCTISTCFEAYLDVDGPGDTFTLALDQRLTDDEVVPFSGGQRAGNFDELVISLPSSHFASPPPSPATLDSVSDDVDDDEPAVPHSPGVSQSRKSRKYRRGNKGSPDLLQAADTEEATSADGAEGSGAGPSQPMHADAEQHGRPRRLRQKYANVQAQLNVKAETEARVALDKKKDYARTSLIFNAPGITGEVWRAFTALQMVDMKASPRGMW